MSEHGKEVANIIRLLMGYIPDGIIDCHGSKCRQSWCSACYDEERNEEAMAEAAATAAEATRVLSALETPPPSTHVDGDYVLKSEAWDGCQKSIQRARDKALEEAAKVAEEEVRGITIDVFVFNGTEAKNRQGHTEFVSTKQMQAYLQNRAAAIRAMKSQSPPPQSNVVVEADLIERVENCVLFSTPAEYAGLADHAAFEAGQDNAIANVVKMLRAALATTEGSTDA